ncbi:hypothetical protein [Undibacterium macrobrachii]|jgi:hypothetical protein|uniref:Uncharacterized protein n=1 Tax=Undibacterium macrobrachii TaxID=1119058 RepID=A0ABQ2XCV0_9BURK|nr:hypothetical protein [Undibacterium macrobrachii]GGX10520.1 hypothetical protein GCM10011282_16020 [Undibacterium macrobrachii]
MARYLPVFALAVKHEYFEGDAHPDRMGLVFTPDKDSAIIMQQENLLLRRSVSGFEIWQEQRVDSVGDASAEMNGDLATLNLTFSVTASDPAFNSYTKWELDKPIQFENKDSVRLTATQLDTNAINLSSSAGLIDTARHAMQVQFYIRIAHVLKQGMTRYEIELKAKALHWKYFFTGAIGRKAVEIFNLDGSSKEDELLFQRSTELVNNTGTAFLSKVPFPMRSIPTQRFQLREEGANGRVLMRRLPNASIHQIGKEGVPGGQTLVVAEIYIHQ